MPIAAPTVKRMQGLCFARYRSKDLARLICLYSYLKRYPFVSQEIRRTVFTSLLGYNVALNSSVHM